MTELADEKTTDQRQDSIADDPMQVVQVGLDDGYAYTKVALPDGRLVSRCRRGRAWVSAGVTWIRDVEQRIFEYETGWYGVLRWRGRW
jgi:plasmid segregation protein ParM